MGNHSTLSLGVSPDIFFILSISMVVLMGFNAFVTRLQSLWIMFFCQKRFSLWSEKPNAGQNPFFHHFHLFRQHVTLTYVSAGFCQRTFSTDPWVVSSKRYTL